MKLTQRKDDTERDEILFETILTGRHQLLSAARLRFGEFSANERLIPDTEHARIATSRGVTKQFALSKPDGQIQRVIPPPDHEPAVRLGKSQLWSK
jgi:hypothetical protein